MGMYVYQWRQNGKMRPVICTSYLLDEETGHGGYDGGEWQNSVLPGCPGVVGQYSVVPLGKNIEVSPKVISKTL